MPVFAVECAMRWATSADSAISLKLKGWVAAARRLSMPCRHSCAQMRRVHGSEATARRLEVPCRGTVCLTCQWLRLVCSSKRAQQ